MQNVLFFTSPRTDFMNNKRDWIFDKCMFIALFFMCHEIFITSTDIILWLKVDDVIIDVRSGIDKL